MHRIAIVLLLGVALSGCASEAPAEPTPDGIPDVEAGPDTGALAGTVVDITIAPIVGATIVLGNDEYTATSDERGGFAIADITPGVYFLEISAPGHLNTTQAVEVTAGEVSKIRVLMQIDYTPAPYHQTYKHDGFVGFWAPGPSYVVQLLYPDETVCDCEMRIEPGGNLTQFVFEAFWEATVVVPELEDMSWELDSYEGDSLDTQEGEYAPSPIYAQLDRELYSKDSDNWLARITPGIAAGVYIQQSYQMFVTTFHMDDAPEGWSINNAD